MGAVASSPIQYNLSMGRKPSKTCYKPLEMNEDGFGTFMKTPLMLNRSLLEMLLLPARLTAMLPDEV